MSYNSPYRALGWKYGINRKTPYARNFTAGRAAALPGLKHGRGRGETRYVDNNPAPIDVNTTTGTTGVYPLNLTTQGSALQNRLGNKIALKSLQMKYHFQIKAPTVANPVPQQDIRVIIFYDKQTNGSLPSISDVISSVDQNGTVTCSTDSYPNNFNRDRFVILADSWFHLPQVTWNSTLGTSTELWLPSMSELRFDRYIKLKNIETCYKANAGTIGDVSTGGLFIMHISNAGTTPYVQIDFSARLKFADN